MEITWHGYSCVTIKTKEGTAVINPYQPEIGLKLPSLKANVVLESEDSPGYNNAAAVTGEPKVLSWPGEYEVAGIAITAQELRSEKAKSMLFVLDADGLKVCYVTDFKVPLTDEIMESIGEIDILIAPVGGEENSYKEAHQAIEEIEPRVVIPVHYKTEGQKVELATIDNFAKQAGITNVQPRDKFSVNSKGDLPQDKTDFVVLNAITA